MTRTAAKVPRITIVTPSYNQAPYVVWTVRSVLLQRYPNLEYILMDGGSNDGTVEALAPYVDRFHTIVSEKDEGQSDAVRRGFERSSGEIMAWLNSDDMLAPGALHFVGRFFAEHEDVDFMYSHRCIVNEANTVIGYWILPRHSNYLMKRWDLIPQETCFWRRSLFEKCGNVDPSYQFALDYELFVRFMKQKARFRRVNRFVAVFRIHGDSKTSRQLATVGTNEIQRVIATHAIRFRPHDRIRGRIFRYRVRLRGAWHARRQRTLPGALAGTGYNYDEEWAGLLADPHLPPQPDAARRAARVTVASGGPAPASQPRVSSMETSAAQSPLAAAPARYDRCPDPVFIGGFKRSGTSYLMKVLQSHPECFGFNTDANIIGPVLSAWLPSGKGLDRYAGILKSLGGEQDRVRKLVRANMFFVYEFTGRPIWKKRIVEKTPSSEAVFPQIAEIFPQAHFIAIVRHPYGAIRSALAHSLLFYSDESRNISRSFIGLVREWTSSMRTIADIVERMGDHMRVVDFDRFVEDPAAGAAALFRFCKLDDSKTAVGKALAGAGERGQEKIFWQRILNWPAEEFERRFSIELSRSQKWYLENEAVSLFERVAACASDPSS